MKTPDHQRQTNPEKHGKDEIFITGYRKTSVSQTGGEHSLKQGWYIWDPEIISQEIETQNPTLFQE